MKKRKILALITGVIILVSGMAALTACQTIGSPLEDYKWVLVQYGESAGIKQVIADTEVYAFFDSRDKTVTGSGGCNIFGGKYEVDGLTLKVSDIFQTTLSCGGEKYIQESVFLNIMKNAENFEMERGQLIIYGGKARLIFNNTNLTVKPPTKWGE